MLSRARIIASLALATALASALASSAGAQSPTRERSLDVTVGVGTAMRGDYRSEKAPAGDAMFSVPFGARLRWAVSFSAQAGLENTDDCIRTLPSGPCLEPQPLVVAWSALIGHEWRSHSRWALRTFAGPSIVRLYENDRAPYRWVSMGGLTARIDVVSLQRVDLIASLRATLAPAMAQRARGTIAFGLGVGLH